MWTSEEKMKLACKVLSARWIMTVVASVVFFITATSGLMPMDDVKMILAVITTFYFTRKRETEQ